jgi:hypothetical protein
MAALKVPVTDENHSQRPETARVTLVEYGNYECPHCGMRIQSSSGCRSTTGIACGLCFAIFR